MIRMLPRTEWANYFNTFSHEKSESGRIDYAEIRVLSLEDGVQPQTHWIPLQGLTFDKKSDLLEVQVPGLDHLVGHPEVIYVDEKADRLDRLQIVRRNGTKEIIEFR